MSLAEDRYLRRDEDLTNMQCSNLFHLYLNYQLTEEATLPRELDLVLLGTIVRAKYLPFVVPLHTIVLELAILLLYHVFQDRTALLKV